MSVYAIGCGGLVKVGYSANPERRVAGLFRSSSRYGAPRAAYEARGEQRLISVIDGGTKSDEHAIHLALADFSIGCEWFVDEPPVHEFLAAFVPGTWPVDEVRRTVGPAMHEFPPSEQGGGNVDLALEVFARRMKRGAA